MYTLNGVKKVNHKCREVQVEVTPVFRNVSQVHVTYLGWQQTQLTVYMRLQNY